MLLPRLLKKPDTAWPAPVIELAGAAVSCGSTALNAIGAAAGEALAETPLDEVALQALGAAGWEGAAGGAGAADGAGVVGATAATSRRTGSAGNVPSVVMGSLAEAADACLTPGVV